MFRKFITATIIATASLGFVGIHAANATITPNETVYAGYQAGSLADGTSNNYDMITAKFTIPVIDCTKPKNLGTQYSTWVGLQAGSGNPLIQSGITGGCFLDGTHTLTSFAVIEGSPGPIDPQGEQEFGSVTLSEGDNITLTEQEGVLFGATVFSYVLTDNTTTATQTLLQSCPTGTDCTHLGSSEVILESGFGPKNPTKFGTITYTNILTHSVTENKTGGLVAPDSGADWNTTITTLVDNLDFTPVCATPGPYVFNIFQITWNHYGCAI